MSETDQTTLEEQERSDRPTRHVPRNWENVDDPETERMGYRNERMSEALGIPFVNSRKSVDENDESVMAELGVDQI